MGDFQGGNRPRVCLPGSHQVSEAGRPLLRYAEQLALLESETLAELGVPEGAAKGEPGAVTRVPLVVNADSLDSWFAAVFANLGGQSAITLDIRVEDQDHSLALLREGSAMAGVSAAADAVQGCRVEALGVMRYRALATPTYVARHFPAGVDAATLARAPMLMFNRKDALQEVSMRRLTSAAVRPPTHAVPTTGAFVAAIERGLAWGMVPEVLAAEALAAGALVDIVPGEVLDVPLYWHRWRIASQALDTLTRHVREAAGTALRPASHAP